MKKISFDFFALYGVYCTVPYRTVISTQLIKKSPSDSVSENSTYGLFRVLRQILLIAFITFEGRCKERAGAHSARF
jgi:hypothetical protein